MSIRAELAAATTRLRAAGVPTPRADAELLAAHLLGVPRTRLGLLDAPPDELFADYRALVEQRAQRVPLHYVTGIAGFGPIEVQVGPGVFVPRPETEALLEWALGALPTAGSAQPVLLDLCTGSGALALALAHDRPDAIVHAIEADPRALAWARRNAIVRADAGDRPIELRRVDVTDPRALVELTGQVDLVVANPPYVPVGAPIDPEVARYEPPGAVFAGADGLSVIRPLIANVTRWLRPGGAVAVEHDDAGRPAVLELFTATRMFDEITAHSDLAGRPRFVTARRADRMEE